MRSTPAEPALSVVAAASEAPDRPAVVTDAEVLTWAGLADRVRTESAAPEPAPGRAGPPAARPLPLTVGNDLPSLVRVHACIAAGTPMLLLHPRLTGPERDRLIEGAGEVRAGTGDDAVLAVVHTSGTGGTPRGVVLTRGAFRASAGASAANLGWEEDDRWLLPLPVAHVGGLSIVTRCLLARRPVVLAAAGTPEALDRALRRHAVTLVSLVPTQLERLLRARPAIRPPAHLRALLLGGAPASPDLLTRAADAGWPVLTTYGLTEACSQVTTQRYGTVNRGERGSGQPLPGIEVRIGDDDEIQVRGPTLFSGYVPPPDRDPLLPGGWLPTGDRGRLDDVGRLHVLGRRSDRIITGGENVDPVEVEQALERLPSIAEACVFGAPDAEWGEVVSAAVVVAPGASLDDVLEEVRGLGSTLAGFKRPRRLAALDALPLNATGKVDRRQVARIATPSLHGID